MNGKAYLYLNYTCNNNCIFCASDFTNRTKGIKALTLEKVRCELDKQATFFDRLLISGGEPTVHKEIFEILRYAKKKFPQVSLATNGILLSDYSFAKEIVKTGITRLAIPFYHTDRSKFSELVNNDNAYDSIISAIKNLMQLKSRYDFSLNVKLLILKENFMVNPDVIDFIKEIFPKLKYMTLATLRISQRVLNNLDRLIVNFNEARPYVSETVRRMLKHSIYFVFDSVPLCLLEVDLLFELLNAGIISPRKTFNTVIRPETVMHNKLPSYYESLLCTSCVVKKYCSRVPKKNHQYIDYDAQLCCIQNSNKAE